MNRPFDVWFFIGAWAWIAGWVGASIMFRLNRGKRIFPKIPDGAIYSERRGSGRSLDTFWAKIGGASNCLLIAVTRDSLIVTPRFPFTLMFLPEIYGLELEAPRARVRIENPASGIFGNRVTLVVDGVDQRRMQLKLQDRSAFLAAIGWK